MANQKEILFHDQKEKSQSFSSFFPSNQVLIFSDIRLPSPIYQTNLEQTAQAAYLRRKPLGIYIDLKTYLNALKCRGVS
jgi:hypothetical protein